MILQILLMLVFASNKTESYLKVLPFLKRPNGLFSALAMGSENTLASPQSRHDLYIGHSFLQSQDLTIDTRLHYSTPYPSRQEAGVDSPTVPSQTWNLLSEALDIHLKNRFDSTQKLTLACC